MEGGSLRDLKRINGPKVKVDFIDEALTLVRQTYPGAMMEGSLCSYSFTIEGEKIIAEAWPQRSKGWWLRILRKNQ